MNLGPAANVWNAGCDCRILSGCAMAALGRSRRSTQRAGSGHSPRVRKYPGRIEEADIQPGSELGTRMVDTKGEPGALNLRITLGGST